MFFNYKYYHRLTSELCTLLIVNGHWPVDLLDIHEEYNDVALHVVMCFSTTPASGA